MINKIASEFVGCFLFISTVTEQKTVRFCKKSQNLVCVTEKKTVR